MKKRFIIVLLLLFVSKIMANEVRSGSIGGGLSIGTPTGLAIKYWATNTTAFAFVLGVAQDGSDINTSLSLQADYLIHDFSFIKVKVGRLPVHYGLGVWISNSIGARGVVGLTYLMADKPMEFFLDIAPSLRIIPTLGFGISPALGGRYYF